MKIPYAIFENAREIAVSRGAAYIRAGVQSHGDHAMDQRGRWSVSTDPARPWFCPPGQPWILVAVVRDTGRGVEITAPELGDYAY
jgi:hypothetical protein